MRWLFVLLASALVPGVASAASQHACSAPLILAQGGGAVPLPELEFTLWIQALGPDATPFVAQGQRFDGLTHHPMVWTGMWMQDGDTLRLIGLARGGAEWRGQSVVQRDSVLMLNVDRGDEAPLMVRCLPGKGL